MGIDRDVTDTTHWYGPSYIGAMRGIGGFQAHHQRPFLEVFPDRVGADHEARRRRCFRRPDRLALGQGDLRWSLARLRALGGRIAPRMADVRRWAGDRLAETGVFIDIPNGIAQAGVDAFAGMRAVADSVAR